MVYLETLSPLRTTHRWNNGTIVRTARRQKGWREKYKKQTWGISPFIERRELWGYQVNLFSKTQRDQWDWQSEAGKGRKVLCPAPCHPVWVILLSTGPAPFSCNKGSLWAGTQQEGSLYHPHPAWQLAQSNSIEQLESLCSLMHTSIDFLEISGNFWSWVVSLWVGTALQHVVMTQPVSSESLQGCQLYAKETSPVAACHDFAEHAKGSSALPRKPVSQWGNTDGSWDVFQ